MRPNPFFGIILTAGCMAPSAGHPASADDLAISLTRTTLEARPAVVVKITNRSAATTCVRGELLRNPHSYEMDLRLRDRKGRAFRPEQPGFLPPPIMDPVRIAPGASVEGQFFLDSRFKFRGSRKLTGGLSAQAAFRYDLCDASQSRRAVSAWQRI